jgi:hypothetical protein
MSFLRYHVSLLIASALSIRITNSFSIGAILTACAIAASSALVLDRLPATLLLTLCAPVP